MLLDYLLLLRNGMDTEWILWRDQRMVARAACPGRWAEKAITASVTGGAAAEAVF
jgi:hypothetical protein